MKQLKNLISRVFISESKKEYHLAPDALSMLLRYQWPGNIRQLINAVRYAIAISDNNVITANCLPVDIGAPLLSDSVFEIKEDNKKAPLPVLCEKGNILLEILRKHKWNISTAANELNISRSTIYRRMERYSIKQPNAIY